MAWVGQREKRGHHPLMAGRGKEVYVEAHGAVKETVPKLLSKTSHRERRRKGPGHW